MSVGSELDLWSLVRRPGKIDVRALWDALAHIAPDATLDYRTRLLAHEALEALAARRGKERLRNDLAALPNGRLLVSLWESRFDEEGFPSLRTHLVEATTPDDILRMLRDLGQRLREPAQIVVGGSAALMLARLLLRQTEDIDVVDEVPSAIRADPALVDELAARHKLRLAHFASHYLPDGWATRLTDLGSFGRLDVKLVDPLDVLCGKLFSRRIKDFEDLQAAWASLDADALRDRLRSSTAGLRSDPDLADVAAKNWYVLSGEMALPSGENLA